MTTTLAALLVELRSLTDVRAIGLAERIEAEVRLCAKHDGCVSAEKVRGIITRIGYDMGRHYRDPAMCDVIRCTHQRWLRELLPPKPSALERLDAEMASHRLAEDPNWSETISVWRSLLRRAKEDAK